MQLLWGVNISLRRRLTLMLLFSGALFIMMAGTIRAVTILTVRTNHLPLHLSFTNELFRLVPKAQYPVAPGPVAKPLSQSS